MTARIADRLPEPVKVAHADLMHRLRWRREPIARITRAFVDTHGLRIQAGPFAGLTFSDFAVGRAELVVAQLLGAYENELHPAIEQTIAGGYEQIVDIGASDGYYAAGFAHASPGSTVVAYEMNPFPARVCRSLAAENKVADRVELRGECKLADLAALPEVRSFFLCDCEGAEDQLMRPDEVPLLARSRAIVELHEHIVPGIRDRIVERFEPTHEIEIVSAQPRYIGDWPALNAVPRTSYVDRELGLSEFRPHRMSWAVMEPRERH